MDGLDLSGGTDGAGIQPVGDLPGRQPLPGLPEDLAAATSLPMDTPHPSPPGNGPMQVSLPWQFPGHLRCGLLCSLELSSRAVCASTHRLHWLAFTTDSPEGGSLKTHSSGRDAVSQEQAVAQKREEVRRKLRERRVPSSPFGRVMGFAQLGASLVYGTMSDSVSQYFGGPKPAETDPQQPSNRCAPTP